MSSGRLHGLAPLSLAQPTANTGNTFFAKVARAAQQRPLFSPGEVHGLRLRFLTLLQIHLDVIAGVGLAQHLISKLSQSLAKRVGV